jgi:hypothetical protein
MCVTIPNPIATSSEVYDKEIKMNMLPTNAQAWMGLTRQQLVSAIVLLALLVAMAVAIVGASIYTGEQAYSTENSSLLAARPRCPWCGV